MPVTQRVQAPGSWQASLSAKTPRQVTDEIAVETYGFSHLCVVPTWIDPSTVDATGMFAASRYTGRYITQGDRLELSGDHVTAWLGDGDGVGLSYGLDFTSNQSLSDWVADIMYGTDAIGIGTVTGGSGTLDWVMPAALGARDALDFVAKHFGVEWRVRNSLILDVGAVVSLYTTTPTVIATPWWDGADVALQGIRSTISLDRSLERYAAYVEAVTGTQQGGLADPTPTYFDGFGNAALIIHGIRVASGMLYPELLALATAESVDKFTYADLLTIRTDTFCPLRSITPGDFIKVWDPENRVFGLGGAGGGQVHETHYGGHICWPIHTRVYGITMLLRQGMGVYMVRGVDGAIVDLTDYIVWESGESVLEVGADPRRVSSAVKRTGVGA